MKTNETYLSIRISESAHKCMCFAPSDNRHKRQHNRQVKMSLQQKARHYGLIGSVRRGPSRVSRRDKASLMLLLALATAICTCQCGSSSSSAPASGAAGSSSAPSSSSSSASSIAASAKQHAASLTATAAAARQSAATVLGALGSMVPGLITNVAPLVILFGLGAMMMPALSMSAMNLMRESRRSASDLFGAALGNPMPLPMAPPANLQQVLNQAQQQHQQQQQHFGQVPRPVQGSPQDVYYFTRRSMGAAPGSPFGGNLLNSALAAGLHDLLERVNRAIENADKAYN